jgi:carboxymethylenebutenolidase
MSATAIGLIDQPRLRGTNASGGLSELGSAGPCLLLARLVSIKHRAVANSNQALALIRRGFLDSTPTVCLDLDSSPPVPVISGAAVSHEDLVLEASDGNRFAAFLATPDEPSETGVVILPDVRGLYRFYEELALRFAERGYTALAFDYFGRTAGVEKRDDDFDRRPHVEAVTPEEIQRDVRAAVEHLRSLGVRSVVTVGFCMGGRHSWLAAASGHGLTGAIGFYGRPGMSGDGKPGATQLAAEIDAPILALQAGDDRNITAEDNEAFEHALSDAGVEHELVIYEGAPHSFFDRKQEEFAAVSEAAWTRVLDFLERHGR